jgi:hypothetical protein
VTTKKTPQELLEEIEGTLHAEGLIASEPVPVRCDGCGLDKLDCSEHEGTVVERGTLCADCQSDVDRVESLVGESGKAVQRYVRDGERHFVFLEPGKQPGGLLLITRDNMEQMPYFDPIGIGEDELRRELSDSRLKLS